MPYHRIPSHFEHWVRVCDFNFASLPGWVLKGMAPYNEGSFYVQESKGDLTRDHYLRSPPIEPSLTEFSHTRKIPRWSGRDSNPRLRAQRQARSPLSHQTALTKFERANQS